MLDAEVWSRPRDGMSLTRLPALREAVQAYAQTQHGVLVLRYPGGESGQLWVEELRDWLVALGVPGRDIITEAGHAHDDQIELQVQTRF